MIVWAAVLRDFLADINHAEEPTGKKTEKKKHIIDRVVNLADASMQVGRWTIKENRTEV